MSILLFLLHLGCFAYIVSCDDSSESLLLNHTSTSDQVPDGSRPRSIRRSSLIPSQHTVDSLESVQVISEELQENYSLPPFWL